MGDDGLDGQLAGGDHVQSHLVVAGHSAVSAHDQQFLVVDDVGVILGNQGAGGQAAEVAHAGTDGSHLQGVHMGGPGGVGGDDDVSAAAVGLFHHNVHAAFLGGAHIAVSAHALGQLQALLVQVHHDNLAHAQVIQHGDHHAAHGARADDDGHVVHLGLDALHAVEDAAQRLSQGGQGIGHMVGHHMDGAVGNHEAGEHAVLGEAAGDGVAHAVQVTAIGAQADLAHIALAAGGVSAHSHSLADLELGDLGANLHDLAADLVTHDLGRSDHAMTMVIDAQVAAADGAGADADLNTVFGKLRNGYVLNLDILNSFVNRSTHMDVSPFLLTPAGLKLFAGGFANVGAQGGQVAAGFLEHLSALAVDAGHVVDVGAVNQLVLPLGPVANFHPHIGTHVHGALDGLAFADEQAVLAVHAVETAYGQLAGLQAEVEVAAALVLAGPVIDNALLVAFLGQAAGEGAAVPQQLAVVVFRMTDGQVGEEVGLGVAHGSLEHPGRDSAVDVGLAGNGEAVLAEHAMHSAGPGSGNLLHIGPALHGSAGGVQLLGKALDGDLHGSQPHSGVGGILVLHAVAGEDGLGQRLQLLAVLSDDGVHAGAQLSHAHGEGLDAELLAQLALVADDAQEGIGPEANLQDAHGAHGLDHPRHADEAVVALEERV